MSKHETHGAILASKSDAPSVQETVAKTEATFDTPSASKTAEASESDTKDATSKAKETKAVASTPVTARQTHGATFGGPVSNVQQLIGQRNVSKGSMGSFDTIQSYASHIRKLNLFDLHSHAVESQVVPIDDRERLMKRLETEWTAVASRNPGKGPGIQRRLGNDTEKDRKLLELLKEMQRR